jgi:P27 family predicted phage terminase small subunit
MARKPAPTALKVVKGTRRDRINHLEPVPDASEVIAPAWLEGEALAHWNRLVPDLVAKRVMTSWDVPVFAVLCEAHRQWIEAQRHLDADGVLVEAPVFDRNGKQTGTRSVRSPWWFVQKDCNDLLLRVGGKFGLNPVDRAQLKIDTGHRFDGEDLLTGRWTS